MSLSSREVIEIAKAYAIEELGKKDAYKTHVRRFAQEDWVLNIQAYKVNSRRQRTEVYLFRSRDHEKFVKGSGTRGGLIFLLSQSWKEHGKLAINFRGPRPGSKASLKSGFEPFVPAEIRDLSKAEGIKIAGKHFISDTEGRQLYLRLAGVHPQLEKLAIDSNVDPMQIAFLGLKGVWSIIQSEAIFKHCIFPKSILEGTVKPFERTTFQANSIFLKMLVMTERCLNKIALENGVTEGLSWTDKESWESDREFDFKCQKSVTITTELFELSFEKRDRVILRPHPASKLDRRDLPKHETSGKRIEVFCNDIRWRSNFSNLPQEQIVVLTDGEADIEAQVYARIQQARTIRKPTEARPD